MHVNPVRAACRSMGNFFTASGQPQGVAPIAYSVSVVNTDSDRWTLKLRALAAGVVIRCASFGVLPRVRRRRTRLDPLAIRALDSNPSRRCRCLSHRLTMKVAQPSQLAPRYQLKA